MPRSYKAYQSWIGHKMDPTDASLTHEIRVFAFESDVPIAEQTALVRQIASVKRHIAGLASMSYYLSTPAGKWIEHLSWRAESRAEPITGLSGIEAGALLDRVKAEASLVLLNAS